MTRVFNYDGGSLGWKGDRQVFEVEIGGESLVVIASPITPELPHQLTPAECEIARDAVDGLSNAAIACRRGRSPRTIANQLASIYRKLGVTSRAELTATLVGQT